MAFQLVSPLEVLSLIDWVALGVFLTSYFGYNFFHDCMEAQSSCMLRMHLFEELIEETAESATTEEGRTLLATTMRSYTRSLIFLGTISFFTLSGALSLLISGTSVQRLLSFSLFERVHTQFGVRLRLLTVVLVAGYALLQIIWAIKAAYTLSLSVHTEDIDTIRRYLTHLNLDFLRSIRTFYYLAVVTLWVFGAEFLILGTVFLTFILYRYDFMLSDN